MVFCQLFQDYLILGTSKASFARAHFTEESRGSGDLLGDSQQPEQLVKWCFYKNAHPSLGHWNITLDQSVDSSTRWDTTKDTTVGLVPAWTNAGSRDILDFQTWVIHRSSGNYLYIIAIPHSQGNSQGRTLALSISS
jgi:hypothetical protein